VTRLPAPPGRRAAFWAIVVIVKALVKSRPEPGLWLDEIETPTIGINDVLIRVLRTGICGTDVHIYKWDEWAQATIQVPMAIGHEFVGRIVEVGSNVADFFPGDTVSGEGHVVCGTLPQLPGRTAAPVRQSARRRRESGGCVRRIHRAADGQHLAPS